MKGFAKRISSLLLLIVATAGSEAGAFASDACSYWENPARNASDEACYLQELRESHVQAVDAHHRVVVRDEGGCYWIVHRSNYAGFPPEMEQATGLNMRPLCDAPESGADTHQLSRERDH